MLLFSELIVFVFDICTSREIDYNKLDSMQKILLFEQNETVVSSYQKQT